MRIALVALLSLCAIGHAYAVSDTQLAFDDSPRPGTYGVTVRAVMDASPLAVRHALFHMCEHRARYAYMKECTVFDARGDTAWSYSLLDPPVISPRDYVVVRKVTSDLAPDGTGTLRLVFTEDHSVGPLPRDGVVRVMVNQGHWELSPRDGGKRTFIEYHLVVNPGGRIPLWMARMAARRATPEQLKRIETIARELAAKVPIEVPTPGEPWSRVKVGKPSVPMRAPR